MQYTYDLNTICNFNNILNNDNSKEYLNNNKLISKVYSNNKRSYNIIKYDKNKLNIDEYDSIGKIRSLIFNNNKLICYSPSKAIELNSFLQNEELNKIEECFAEEYIEGTMINVFYDDTINEWNISTRSVIGANVSFFNKDITFSKMFNDACINCNLDINKLNKYYTYSFVLQHPENRIVLPITIPYLYLIRIYKIDNLLIQELTPDNFYTINIFYNNDSNNIPTIGIPMRYPIYDWNTLIEYFGSNNTHYSILGIMIYHNSGVRCKIKNPNYENIKFLRGNQPKLQYQYLVLRKEGKVKDFLYYYPEYKNICNQYRNIIHDFTKNLFNNYYKCYIKKEKPLKEFDGKYKTHMFNIHKIYIDELKINNKFVNKDIIINYINNLAPQQLMYSLNYELHILNN